MWVHPDLVEGQQWITVTNRKSRGKAKVSPCNVVGSSSRKVKTDVASVTDSEEETIILTAEPKAPLVVGTRSGQLFLKKYDEMVTNPLKPTPEPTKQSTKQHLEKQKELRYATQRIKRKDLRDLTTLMSWLNWPTSQP